MNLNKYDADKFSNKTFIEMKMQHYGGNMKLSIDGISFGFSMNKNVEGNSVPKSEFCSYISCGNEQYLFIYIYIKIVMV